MRRVVAMLSLAIVALAVGLALMNAILSRDSLTVVSAIGGTSEPTPQPIPTQPGWETVTNIPLYPGAEGTHDISGPSRTSRYVQYEIPNPDSEGKVDAWYKNYMLRHGWIIDGPGYVDSYIWVDKDGPTPWGLSLRVLTMLREVGGTEVKLQLLRWPNVDKIPLYPGAQQVEVKSVPPLKGDEGEMEVRVTTYVAEAKPDELERYYKPILEEHLWQADEKIQGPINEAPGIVYHHWYGTLPSPEGANLYIFAQPQADGLTNVEMRVEEFNRPYHP